MKREIKDKLISASAVTLFFAAVRPSVVPKMWITVLLAFALYECVLQAFRIHAEIKRDKRIAQNVAFRKRDGEALDRERFKEVAL